MSSTKIVIIVLVLIGLLFIIFVARGALRSEPTARSDQKTAKKTKPPDWTKSIKGLFSSLQPKLPLKEKSYPSSSGNPENIPPDEKHPFRTATFLFKSGTAEITYKDVTPIESGSPLKDMDNPQKCKLPQDPDPDISDRNRCSILAFKRGGTFTFTCTGNTACRVEVE
jgi:hypothetical protein